MRTKTADRGLFQEYQAIQNEISLKNLTVEKVEEARAEWSDPEKDAKTLIEFSEAVFRDFAPYLRDFDARRLTQKYRELSFTESEDLYLSIENVRLLEIDDVGPAVVTIAMDSYCTLKDVLEQLVKGEKPHVHIHCSFGPKAEGI